VENFLILFCNRLIKIFASLTKLLCYVFHFFFPKKRFTLPAQSGPIFRSRKQLPISRIIWQTNYTNRVTLPLYLNYLFNRLLSPSFEYRFMITEARAEFIKQNYPPEIYENYAKLQIGAAQADFWRILVIQKYGGVYMDIDAHLVWPLGYILKPEFDELYVTAKKGEISNYFFASKKDNLHLDQMIKVVMDNISENTLKNVYELTGPGVFNKVLDMNTANIVRYRYSCIQGSFTNEYFQYVDKPQGKWTREQEKIDIVKKDTP
jgi:mannosyltransferase OCH1-like enzyme